MIHVQGVAIVKVSAAVGSARAARAEHRLAVGLRQHSQLEQLEGARRHGRNVAPIGERFRRAVFRAAKIGERGVLLKLKCEEAKREFIEPTRARLVGATPDKRAHRVAGFGQ